MQRRLTRRRIRTSRTASARAGADSGRELVDSGVGRGPRQLAQIQRESSEHDRSAPSETSGRAPRRDRRRPGAPDRSSPPRSGSRRSPCRRSLCRSSDTASGDYRIRLRTYTALRTTDRPQPCHQDQRQPERADDGRAGRQVEHQREVHPQDRDDARPSSSRSPAAGPMRVGEQHRRRPTARSGNRTRAARRRSPPTGDDEAERGVEEEVPEPHRDAARGSALASIEIARNRFRKT